MYFYFKCLKKLLNNYIASLYKIKIPKFLFFNLITNFIVIWQVSYNTLLHYGNEIPTDVPGYIRQAKSLYAMTSPHHSYRIGIPYIANIFNKLFSNLTFLNSLALNNIREDFSYHLSFFVINLLMSSVIFLLLFLILEKLKCNKYIALGIIYSFQLTSTYLGMISLANIDLVVILFLSIFLYLYLLDIKRKYLVIWVSILSLFSILFKEYIFLASLPIVILILKERFESIKIRLSLLISYLIFISSSIFLYRKIFDILTYPISLYKYEGYVKGNITYMIEKLFTPIFNVNTIQNFFQYSPLLIILFFLVSLSYRDFRKLIFKNYILTILPLLIFISLSGVATYPIRVFFPYYFYLLIFIPRSPLIKKELLLKNK